MSFIIIFGIPSFPIRLINQRPQTKILTGLSKSRVHFNSRFSSSENYKLHLITDWLSVKTHHASTKRPPVTMTADSRIAIATTAARDVATNTSSSSLSYWWSWRNSFSVESWPTMDMFYSLFCPTVIPSLTVWENDHIIRHRWTKAHISITMTF